MSEPFCVTYFLRGWKVDGSYDQSAWVICAQNTATGDQRMFPSFEDLLRFLQTEFGDNQSATVPPAQRTV